MSIKCSKSSNSTNEKAQLNPDYIGSLLLIMREINQWFFTIIFLKWSKRGNIIGVNKIQNHVTYYLKGSFIDWLVSQGYLYQQDLADRSENIHNIMVN